MPFTTLDALVGYLLEDPVLESSRLGGSRFVARIVPLPQLAPVESSAAPGMTVGTLTASGVTAQRAYEQFTAGDHFIAAGAVHLALCGIGLACTPGLVFEASYLGHDVTRSRYAVDRTRRRRQVETIAPASRRAEIERELEIAVGPFPPRSARER